MKQTNYQKEMENLAQKFSQNSQYYHEILLCAQHKMFMKGEKIKQAFEDTFEAIKDEYHPLEKVDLLDYWKCENGRTDKTR
ncbi:MAG: hypothetical protein J6A28_02730 [Clostridia bacterium]|nr:hypothetical protein [Clostridia bacterium]